MGPLDAPAEQLAALEAGRAFVDLSSLRKVRVTGDDAQGWLHDLVTTDVASLAHGQARRSLLLTPTGRIRADFMVGRDDEGFLLLQHPEQAGSIGDLLLPYVLSSDVTLRRPHPGALGLRAGGPRRGRGGPCRPGALDPG